MDKVINLLPQLPKSIATLILNLMLLFLTIVFFIITIIPEGYIQNKRQSGITREDFKKISRNFLSYICKPYKLIIASQPLFTKILMYIMGILMVMSVLSLIYAAAIDKYKSLISFQVFLFTILMALIVFTIIHLLLYAIVVPIEVVSEYIGYVKNEIGKLAIFSFFIPFQNLIFLLLKAINIKNVFTLILMASGIIYSHYLTFKGLMICVKEPKKLVSSNNRYKKIDKYKAIFSWLIILLLILFCEVIFVSNLDEKSFISNQISIENRNNNSFKINQIPVTDYFDLFYFTVVTFATVGYGDILPNGYLGKISSILIISSSMLFITIFLGTILSSDIGTKEKIRTLKRKIAPRIKIYKK